MHGLLAGTGVRAETRKGLIHIDVVACRNDTLRLLDENSAVQCLLKLSVYRCVFSSGAFVKENYSRHIGQGLPDDGILIAQRAVTISKQIQCPDCIWTEPHRNGMHGLETLGQRRRLKIGILVTVSCNIAQCDDRTGSIGVNARTGPSLVLQNLDKVAFLASGRDDLKLAMRVRQEKTRCRGVQ